jgi:hypothetical protein
MLSFIAQREATIAARQTAIAAARQLKAAGGLTIAAITAAAGESHGVPRRS